MDRSTEAQEALGTGATATIRDVARAARVSASTVSNLLNGRDGKMRPRTRQRVLRAIDQLGYRPSRVARQLRTGLTNTVGLIVPSVANPAWGRFAQAVEAAALYHHYQVLLCNSERDPDRERVYAEELADSGTRAIIIATSLPSLSHLQSVMQRGVRVIAFDREPQKDDPLEIVNVTVDNRGGSGLAVEHVIRLGHTRIAFLSGAVSTISRRGRLAGYRQALQGAGLPYSPDLVWDGTGESGYGDFSSADLGFQGMQTLLDLEEPPTAVTAINDMYAFGACAAALQRGLRIPEDISIVGFDDIALAELFNPPLTTIHQPVEEMAAYAVDVIHQDAGGAVGDLASISMPGRLVVRRSTGARHDPDAGGAG